LRPLVVDQPQTPMWLFLAALSVALLFASAVAFGWTIVDVGRRIVALSYREPPIDDAPRREVRRGPEPPFDPDQQDPDLPSDLPGYEGEETTSSG